MKLSHREKRVLYIGAAAAGLTILITWVLLPLGREWSRLGRELEPKLGQLELLQARAQRQEALLARRARLIRQVGSLLAPAPGAAKGQQEKGDEPPGKAKEPSAEEKESENPSDPGAVKTDKAPGPGVEAELEKIFKKCQAKIKLVVAKKAPRRTAQLKRFTLWKKARAFSAWRG